MKDLLSLYMNRGRESTARMTGERELQAVAAAEKNERPPTEPELAGGFAGKPW